MYNLLCGQQSNGDIWYERVSKRLLGEDIQGLVISKNSSKKFYKRKLCGKIFRNPKLSPSFKRILKILTSFLNVKFDAVGTKMKSFK